MNYQKMYYLLFNAITDALSEIEKMNLGNAADFLRRAQCDSEELFLSADEKSGRDSPSPKGNGITVP